MHRVLAQFIEKLRIGSFDLGVRLELAFSETDFSTKSKKQSRNGA